MTWILDIEHFPNGNSEYHIRNKDNWHQIAIMNRYSDKEGKHTRLIVNAPEMHRLLKELLYDAENNKVSSQLMIKLTKDLLNTIEGKEVV